MTTVIISVDKEIARYIQYQRQYHGFIKEELIGDQFIMHFRARDIDNEFARWYLMFADRASIIEPQALKDTIRQIVANIKI